MGVYTGKVLCKHFVQECISGIFLHAGVVHLPLCDDYIIAYYIHHTAGYTFPVHSVSIPNNNS